MTLSGITWDHPRGYEPLVASSLLYEKLFGLKVEWEKRSLTNFGDQSLQELAERFDLLIIDHPHAGVAFETNCLFPLDRLLSNEKLMELKDQFAGPCFSSYLYKGSQWALPIDAAMQCSSLRDDLMADMKVPRSWEEVFQLQTMLEIKNLKVGMALCPTDSLCSFLSLTAQMGSPIREENEILVNRETGLRSMKLMRRMRDCFHENSLDWNPIQLYDYMSTHDDIAYAPLAFCYTNYSREGFRKNKLTYCNSPEIANAVLGGAGIAVSAKSKYLPEAAQYAEWITGAAIQGSVYLIEQGQPANIAVWKSDLADTVTNNFFSNTFDSLEKAYVRPRYSGWPEFQKYLGEILHDYLRNDSDPAKTLDHLQKSYCLSQKK